MSHKNWLVVFGKTSQDIRSKKSLKGGLTVLLAGAFQQTLSVTLKGMHSHRWIECILHSFIFVEICNKENTHG